MKVFISWSGKRSKGLAVALKEWLPLILQYVEPWVSDKDISAGDRWAQAIAGELETSNFGIVCITPENIGSEWILFEAGALSKSMQDSKVIPLLFGLELSDLSGPLSQFQALKVDQQGMLDVAKAINNAADSKASDSTIDQLVPALWSRLDQMLNEIPNTGKAEKHMRPQTEILEDLVSQVRGLGSRIPEPELIEERDRKQNSELVKLDSRTLLGIIDSLPYEQGDAMPLVVLAGVLRNRLPWLSEVLLESHRELTHAPLDHIELLHRNLKRTIQETTDSAWSAYLLGNENTNRLRRMDLFTVVERAINITIASRNHKETLKLLE